MTAKKKERAVFFFIFFYASGIYATRTATITCVVSEYNKSFVGFCCRKKK
jgi:hypothetical protein